MIGRYQQLFQARKPALCDSRVIGTFSVTNDGDRDHYPVSTIERELYLGRACFCHLCINMRCYLRKSPA